MHTGEIYHIYNRGNNKETIFKEARNYPYFLDQFKKYLLDKVKVHAYCLMPNHFHFLLEILPHNSEKRDKAGLNELERAFTNFFVSYAKAINKSYDRTGSLFQANFKRKLIKTENQYGLNIAYIHFNPVKAGLCADCSEWEYSSYNAILGESPTKVARTKVLHWFGGRENAQAYHHAYWLGKQAHQGL